jgi:hypothetical protein
VIAIHGKKKGEGHSDVQEALGGMQSSFTLWESSDVRSTLGDDGRDCVCARLTICHRNGQNVAHFRGA